MLREWVRISTLVLVMAQLAAGCGFESTDALGTRSQELRVPGPWAPPANTRAIAATQYVSVVDPPAVSPLGYCTSSNAFACSCTHPACTPALSGTKELDAYLRNRFPYLTSGGLYCCRQNSATTSVPKLSVHAIGRAIDLMVPMESGDANNGLGDPVANWLVENAEFIGVQRVIWDYQYWNGERGFGQLGSNSLSHTNHIHVELSPAGAAKQTPFFTTGASSGACTARCEGTRIIHADCSSGDCAFYGAVCLPGPTCGPAAPPEAPEAVAGTNVSLPSLSPLGSLARLTFVPPRRLFDTRVAASSTTLTRGNGTKSGPLTTPALNTYQDTGLSLPAGTSALWLNLAALPITNPGFLTAFPAGSAQPNTSNLNYFPGYVRANAAALVRGSSGGISFFTPTEVDLIADLTSAFTPTGAGLTMAGPTRVVDTRSSNAPLLPDVTREFDVQAPAGATGVVATIAVIAGAEPSFVSAFPCGAAVPPTSNINVVANTVAANTVLSELGSNGKLCLRSLREAHVIIDVSGYLSPTGSLSYQPLTPKRLLDTRSPNSLYTGRLGAHQTVKLPIQSLAGMPSGVWGVVANLAVLDSTEAGFMTAFPCGGSVPSTSSINFQPTIPVAATTVSGVGSDGSLCVFASTRANLIVDVVGVWVHDASATPPAPTTEGDPADEGEPIEPPPSPEDIGPGDTSIAPDTNIASGDTSSLTDTTVGDPLIPPPTGDATPTSDLVGGGDANSADGNTQGDDGVVGAAHQTGCGCGLTTKPPAHLPVVAACVFALMCVVRRRKKG